MNKKILLFAFISLIAINCYSQELITIEGTVSDFKGNMIENSLVEVMSSDFKDIVTTHTDKNGHYKFQIKKGTKGIISGMRQEDYPLSKESVMKKPEDMRLEFWAWNFVAEKDTTINFRYHRMEAYGINVFRIQGAAPAYQIYVRPMSLTRTAMWMMNKTKEANLSPSSENLDIQVTIDGEEVPVILKQEIKEIGDKDETMNAFLLTVALPKKEMKNDCRIFKLVLTDKENGDQGEGLYYYRPNL